MLNRYLFSLYKSIFTLKKYSNFTDNTTEVINMTIDFSQIDTSSIDRMAVLFGIFLAGGLLFPILIGVILKMIRLPLYIVKFGAMCAVFGWFYYWAINILDRFY